MLGDQPQNNEFYYQITFKRGDIDFEFEAPDSTFAQAQFNRWVTHFTDASIPPVVLKPPVVSAPAQPAPIVESFEQPVENIGESVESVTTLPNVNAAETLGIASDLPSALSEPAPVESFADDTTVVDSLALEPSSVEMPAPVADEPLAAIKISQEDSSPVASTLVTQEPESKIAVDDEFDAFANVLQSALEGNEAAPPKNDLAQVHLPFESPAVTPASSNNETAEISTALEDTRADDALFSALAEDLSLGEPSVADTSTPESASEVLLETLEPASVVMDLSEEALQASTQALSQASVFSSLPASLTEEESDGVGSQPLAAASGDFGAVEVELAFESLQELVELTPVAPGPLDMLLLAAYFLSQIRQQESYSLKELNLELIKSGLTPINHSILEAAVTDGMLMILPDEGESLGATQYSLTSNGLQRIGLLLNPA